MSPKHLKDQRLGFVFCHITIQNSGCKGMKTGIHLKNAVNREPNSLTTGPKLCFCSISGTSMQHVIHLYTLLEKQPEWVGGGEERVERREEGKESIVDYNFYYGLLILACGRWNSSWLIFCCDCTL